MCRPPWHYSQWKFSDLHCSDYWKMYLWKFSSHLLYLIFSLHIKYPRNKFPPKSLFPHAKIFKIFFKKNSPYLFFLVRDEILCFIFISFPISQSFVPSFCGLNYGFSSKTTEPLWFLSHTVWLWSYPDCCKSELQNHIVNKHLTWW